MYLDFDTYKTLGGKITDESEFSELCDIAQSVIDLVTYNRLISYESLPDKIKPFVEKAMFYQIEYIRINGGYEANVSGSNQNIKSESIGNHSVTYGENNTTYKVGDVSVSTLAVNELDKAYLRYRGIRRCRIC